MTSEKEGTKTDKLRIVFIGTYQTNFNVDFALKTLKKSIKDLRKQSVEKGFLYAIEERISSKRVAQRAKEELEKQNLDFLFTQNSSFAPGEIILILADVSTRLGFGLFLSPPRRVLFLLTPFVG